MCTVSCAAPLSHRSSEQKGALPFIHHLRVPSMDLHVLSSFCEAVGDVGPGQVGVKLAWLLFLTYHRGNGLLS